MSQEIADINFGFCPNCSGQAEGCESLVVDDAPIFNPSADKPMKWDGEWGIVVICTECSAQWSIRLTPYSVNLIVPEGEGD